MNTYTFFFESEYLGVKTELQWVVEARRLSQALAHFCLDSKSFTRPVSFFLPRYEVVNSEGKRSVRLLSSKYMCNSPFGLRSFENEN